MKAEVDECFQEEVETETDRQASGRRVKEEEARRKSESERNDMPKLPIPEDMPKTPNPLPTARSIEGLAERAGVEISENNNEDSNDELKSLRDRAEENNELSTTESVLEANSEQFIEEFSEIELEES